MVVSLCVCVSWHKGYKYDPLTHDPVQVKMACRDVVKERGLDRITVEDLVQVTEIV